MRLGEFYTTHKSDRFTKFSVQYSRCKEESHSVFVFTYEIGQEKNLNRILCDNQNSILIEKEIIMLTNFKIVLTLWQLQIFSHLQLKSK